MSHAAVAFAYSRSTASMVLFGLQNSAYLGLGPQHRSLKTALIEAMPSGHAEKEYADAFSLIADFLPGNALDEPLSGFDRSDLKVRLEAAARHASYFLDRTQNG